jgi:hypothetical protein
VRASTAPRSADPSCRDRITRAHGERSARASPRRHGAAHRVATREHRWKIIIEVDPSTAKLTYLAFTSTR